MAKEPAPLIRALPSVGWLPSALAAIVVVIVVVILLSMHQPPRDNSDPIGGRSNMSVLTDALTG